MSEFTDGIRRAAKDRPFGLRFGETENLQYLSWAEVATRGEHLAATLRAAGVGPGDRVGVLAIGANDVAPIAQGVWANNAALTMLQQPTPQADLAEWHSATLRALTMLGARTVVVGEPFTPVIPQLTEAGYRVISLHSYGTTDDVDPIPTAEHDVALYQLTSGSTGEPKAVAITHGNLLACAAAMHDGSAADLDRDVMVSWLPLSHDMGLVGFLLTPMFYGIQTVYVAPTEFLKAPLNWIQLLSDHAATITAGPNFAYSILHRRLKAVDDGIYDLRNLRFVLCGAEPIGASTMTEFARQARRFGMNTDAIVAAYGLAEATLAVSFATLGEGLRVERLDVDDFERRRRATIASDHTAATKELVVLGRPLLGFEVKVIDSNGTELPERGIGELLIRGTAVTTRYATVVGDVDAVDSDGWLHTGDLGYLTETGEVVVCGRLKNVIIIAGRNIFPSELERIAESCDGVRRGAVVAFGAELPDGREEITIVAEAIDSYDAETRRDIRRQIARSVYSVTGLSPNVLLVDRGMIPKTPSGKIRHLAAKAQFAGSR